MSETGNRAFQQVFSDLVNLVIKQKGGKRGIVKSVDEPNLVCNVDPDDKSATIEGARLTALGKGDYPVPKIGSKVSLMPLHMEDDSENDWGVVQVSEITKYFISAEEEVTIQAKNVSIIVEEEIHLGGATEPIVKGDKLQIKLDTLMTAMIDHVHTGNSGQPTSKPNGMSTIDFSSIKSDKVKTE